jgi:sporulation protein YtfJ
MEQTMAVEELVQTVMEQLKNIAHTEVHIGKPMQMGETYIVPVSKISMGFGAGGVGIESDGKYGRGTGGGVSIDPVAFLVVQNDQVQLLNLSTPGSPVGRLVDLLPEVIEQVRVYMQARMQEE